MSAHLRAVLEQVGEPPLEPGEWPVRFVREWLARAPRTPRAGDYDSGFGLEVRSALYQAGAGLQAREQAAHLASWWSLAVSEPSLEQLTEACVLSPARHLAALHLFPNPRFAELARACGLWDARALPPRPPSVQTRAEVVVLSGLPGVGKDTWIHEHWRGPVISLDALRAELRVDHQAPQEPVLAEAWERARASLSLGEGFAWNATNLRRRQRLGLVSRLRGLGARVVLVNLEAPCATVRARNRQRQGEALATRAWQKLMTQWESVWPGEADEERWLDRGDPASLF